MQLMLCCFEFEIVGYMHRTLYISLLVTIKQKIQRRSHSHCNKTIKNMPVVYTYLSIITLNADKLKFPITRHSGTVVISLSCQVDTLQNHLREEPLRMYFRDYLDYVDVGRSTHCGWWYLSSEGDTGLLQSRESKLNIGMHALTAGRS